MSEELKIGATISRATMAKLQTAHDAMAALGVSCQASNGKSVDFEEMVVSFGNEVKVLSEDNHLVKVGGYLVRFGNETEPDLSKAQDFFDDKTDFKTKFPAKSLSWFNHRMPVKVEIEGKKRQMYIPDEFEPVELTKDSIGVFLEGILDERKEYDAMLIQLARMGKLGLSSGTAGHLVKRTPMPNGTNHIDMWALGLDASYTHTPAEYRNSVIPIKSLITSEAAATDNDETKAVTNLQETNNMDTNEIKALFDEQKTAISALVKNEAEAAATKAVENVLDKLPEVKAKMNANIEVVVAEEDRPFATPGAFFMAVKNAGLAPHSIDPKLKGLKATGLSEAVPSQAGFLVPQTTAAGILEKMHGTGSLMSMFTNRDSVAGNNMTYNVVDETSRADGSRYGGVTGYWGAEGGTKVASKPTFRQLELKLKKVYALCVATDELLEDAPALAGWLSRTVPNELRFKVEDAIINGDGVGKPLGILNSGALKTAVRTDDNEIDALDLGRMWAGRYTGVNDYIWLGNPSIFPQLLSMSIGNMPVYLPSGGVSGLPYSTLLGRPYMDIEYSAQLGTIGDLLLVSPSQYQMIEKAGGIQTASSIHVYFTSDESAFRFVYRVDGAPIWQSALTGKDALTYSPFVGLASTT